MSYHIAISRLRCELWLLHIKHNVMCGVRTRTLSKLVYYKFMCNNKWGYKLGTTGKIQLIRIYDGREDALCY